MAEHLLKRLVEACEGGESYGRYLAVAALVEAARSRPDILATVRRLADSAAVVVRAAAPDDEGEEVDLDELAGQNPAGPQG